MLEKIYKFSDEHRKKLSIAAKKRKPNFLGKKHSENSKNKISKTKKGQRVSPSTEFKNGCIPWNKGKNGVYSKDVLENWSKKRKGKQIKEKHPNWQGGLSFQPYTIDWTETLKKSIRERDGYTCQLCGKPQNTKRKHSIHHIDYDKKNCNPNNLITLCTGCHTKTGFNRNKWKKYFTKIIKKIYVNNNTG